MLFQTLDDKSECVGIYCDGSLHFDAADFPAHMSKTWKYSEYLRDRGEIEYANLYVQDKKMEEVIPEYLREDWNEVAARLLAFRRSLGIGKVDIDSHCIFDLIPTRFLADFCEVKNIITDYVITHYERPQRYEYLLKVCQLLEDISNRPLKINDQRLKAFISGEPRDGPIRRLLGAPPYIRYNQFGTKTGRLTTRRNSFPILTLKKRLRSVVEPRNDYFLELDFNGAEVRVLLGMLGMPQPSDDVHEFHRREIFGKKKSREEVKTAFFAWLYGSKSAETRLYSKHLEKFYNKEQVLDQYWDGKKVYTPYRKEIDNVDEHHALNYIVQSTCAELTLLQALKIDHLLRSQGSHSHIACIIHDAIVIDFSQKDEALLGDIKQLMESTKFGRFKINVSSGNDLGNLKEFPT